MNFDYSYHMLQELQQINNNVSTILNNQTNDDTALYVIIGLLSLYIFLDIAKRIRGVIRCSKR